MIARPAPSRRDGFVHFTSITTRWADNDAYRHVNNVVYYGFFDTAVNQQLIEAGVLDVERSGTVGLVVETQCRYHAPVSFPDRVTVGLRVGHLGTSSLRYELAVFRNGDAEAAAEGHLVHVYVDRATQRPVPLPAAVRAAVAPLLWQGGERCPRCGGDFHCGIDDAGPCACTGLVLSPALQARLRASYAGCLCLRCLEALAAQDAAPNAGPAADTC